jgi:hypothetical protein
MKGLFVAGTDTGVGKTLVAAGLARLFANQDIKVGVFKPVASGGFPAKTANFSRRPPNCPIQRIQALFLYIISNPSRPGWLVGKRERLTSRWSRKPTRKPKRNMIV